MKNYSMIWAYTYLNDDARLKRCGVYQRDGGGEENYSSNLQH